LRISPIAPPGSLLKGAGVARDPKKRYRAPKGKATRQDQSDRNAKYLALVRRCPCMGCDNDPAKVAAHVRMTRTGKPIAGTSAKPGDNWTLPLCAACHTDYPGAQHQVGEVTFWQRLKVDPLPLCQRLYHAAPDIQAMRQVIFAAREKRA
jgi:hypothetical protein